MSKQEQLDLFTSDGRMTPKDDVVNLSPTGEVNHAQLYMRSV